MKHNPRNPKLWLSLLGIPLLLAFSPVSAPPVEALPADFANPCAGENDTFNPGEEITYKLFYNWNFVWLSAGEVTFRVKDIGNEYHLSARGRTYKSYEWFYKVRDNYDTYIDKETLLPRVSIRDVHEGGYRLYDRVTFDQNGKKARSLRGKTRDTALEESFDLSNCMHDILSIVYYARNLDFDNMQPNQEIPIEIFFDREAYPLKVKYLGKEDKKKVKGSGKYNTHVFSPEVIAGEVFKEDDQMKVWVSRDENKIPLLIESPVSVGSVKCVLKSYKGLKYDFRAKAK